MWEILQETVYKTYITDLELSCCSFSALTLFVGSFDL